MRESVHRQFRVAMKKILRKGCSQMLISNDIIAVRPNLEQHIVPFVFNCGKQQSERLNPGFRQASRTV